MDNWNKLLAYYVRIGLPEDFIRHVCIDRSAAKYITQRIETINPHSVLEIGSFIGLSTGIIAMASSPNCKLVCVDLNLPVKAHTLVGSGDFQIHDTTSTLTHVEKILEHFQLLNPVTLLKGFFSCRLNKDVMEKVSKEYPEVAQIRIIGDQIFEYGPFDIILIDGDHSERGVVSDLEIVSKCLNKGGEILLHDVSGDWSCGVNVGIVKFLEKHRFFELIETKSSIGRIVRKERL